MKVSPCTLAILLLVASVPVLQAAGADTNSAILSPTNGSPDLLSVLMRLVGALVLVVALLLAGAWFFKRSRFFPLYQGAPSQLRILESRSLGQRNSLMVVGYSQQRFLVAVSATGVSLLTALPDAEAEEPSTVSRTSFSEHLTSFQEQKTR